MYSTYVCTYLPTIIAAIEYLLLLLSRTVRRKRTSPANSTHARTAVICTRQFERIEIFAFIAYIQTHTYIQLYKVRDARAQRCLGVGIHLLFRRTVYCRRSRTSLYICAYVYTYTYVCMYINIYTYRYIYMYACTSIQ